MNNLPDKMYVVCFIEMEYNDEYYYTTESDAVTPQKAFASKGLAEAFAKQSTIELWNDSLLSEYPSSFLTENAYYKIEDIAKANGISIDWYCRSIGDKGLKSFLEIFTVEKLLELDILYPMYRVYAIDAE